MLETWCQEFSPDTFLEQTAATFGASLRGRAKQRKHDAERDISLAWHTAAFAGAAQAGKLKPLTKYLAPMKPRRPQTAAEMLAVLKGIGAPMSIKRVN